MANNHHQCEECGCACKKCISYDQDVHLHVEIENLKQRLIERDSHISRMETNFLNEANKFPNGELAALKEELLTWQDKYRRLYESHKRVQRVNQGLEDKLLKLVDVGETEKNALTKDVATLSHRLAEANYAIKKLQEDNERYKSDVSLAIQFLQCKQTNFVAQRFDSLPNEVQAKVYSYIAGKRKPDEKKPNPEVKNIKVPIPTFPPTAMVYSVPKSPNLDSREREELDPTVDIVSAAIMAKVLEERERERATKHCDTCTCSKNVVKIVYNLVQHSIGTQTGEWKNNLCLSCNSNLEKSPRGMKIVRSCESLQDRKVPIYTEEYDKELVQIYIKHENVKTEETVSDSKIDQQNLINSLSSDDSLITFDSKNDKISEKTAKNSDNGSSIKHHRLCNQKSLEKSDPEKMIKGPRYCSMRLQTGTKNILLDNAHSNVAPVLYKRPSERITARSSHTESCSSEDRKCFNLNEAEVLQNHLRVAEWVQNSVDNEVSSSDNSRSDSLKKDLLTAIERQKYVEMENNVKKFLFGENQNETLKKGVIGEKKHLKDCDSSASEGKSLSSWSNSHTETEI